MMCPHTESPGVLNQAINVAKLSFHHVQSMMTGSGMPSGSLNENLRTRLKFEIYLTYLLLLVQKL